MFPVGRVFVNGLGDLGSNLGHVILKTLKMVLDTFLYGIHIFSSLKLSNKNILKNILEIYDQNRISI